MTDHGILGDIAGAAATDAVLHFGAKLGARFIPGLGWALTGYEVGAFAYEAVTGRSFSETAVGSVVGTATDAVGSAVAPMASAAGDAALSMTKGILRMAGFGKAVQAIDGDARFGMTGRDAMPAGGGEAGAAVAFERTPMRLASLADLPTPALAAVGGTDLDMLDSLFRGGPAEAPLTLGEAHERTGRQGAPPDGKRAGAAREVTMSSSMAPEAQPDGMLSTARGASTATARDTRSGDGLGR